MFHDKISNPMPTIPDMKPTDVEMSNRQWLPENLTRAVYQLKQQGCLVVRNALTQAQVDMLRIDHDRAYTELLRNVRNRTVKGVRDLFNRRVNVNIALRDSFLMECYWANPFCLPILDALLGQEMILGASYSIIARSRSTSQARHIDHYDLYGGIQVDSIRHLIPAHAYFVMTPLVAIHEKNGPTRCWPGSHLLTEMAVSRLPQSDGVNPILNKGDMLLMDHRLAHLGLGNQTSNPRPLLFLIYQRPWFRDSANFYRQKLPTISMDDFERVPPNKQHLIKHLIDENRRFFCF